ncbi:hypothetical protein Leryth_019145 [Lithospermum erythrorhizon]|nr:hypothetical protein Leryth_019145 [Lithospermum erythrorhizon]
MIHIYTWIYIGTKINQTIKTGTHNYQIVVKLNKKYLFYLMIHQDKKEYNKSHNKS